MTKPTPSGIRGRERAMAAAPRWFRRLGPGLITACVVIGPGSILTSSQVGARNGLAMAWVILVAVACMQIYMLLGARLGLVAQQSPAKLLADRVGRWLAVLVGCSVFFIAASFQFGNNVGVASAFRVLGYESDWLIVAFNGLALAFLFGFRNLYRAVERLMAAFVAVMLVAFTVNLGFALAIGPPERPSDVAPAAWLDLSVLGLVGTTFVIAAAYYQAYLVQQKGWNEQQLRSGLLDARVSSAIMGLITLMIMATAATMLRGQSLGSVAEVGEQLQPLFGTWGQLIFCIGLFSAAYSSFLVNSMIGGFVLSDGLGLGHRPDHWWPRLLTAAALLTGMGVALLQVRLGWEPVPAIVAAQAVTVVAAPLLAGTLLWLTNMPSVMGPLRNGLALNLPAGAAFLILLAMAWHLATVRIPALLAG